MNPAWLYLIGLLLLSAFVGHSYYLWRVTKVKHWKTVLIPVGENWEQPVISKQFHTYNEAHEFATDWWKLTEYVWVIANVKTEAVYSGTVIQHVDV